MGGSDRRLERRNRTHLYSRLGLADGFCPPAARSMRCCPPPPKPPPRRFNAANGGTHALARIYYPAMRPPIRLQRRSKCAAMFTRADMLLYEKTPNVPSRKSARADPAARQAVDLPVLLK